MQKFNYSTNKGSIVDHKEIVELLVELGLSNLEAKIYIALVKLKCGPVTVKAISATAEVVRQDTYRVLSNLYDRGIVEKALTNPNTFKCITLEQAISRLLKDNTQKFQVIKKKSQIAMKQYRINPKVYEPENLAFLTLSNTELLISKWTAEIEKTQSTIEMIYAPQRLSVISFHLIGVLTQALDRGVDIYLVTTTKAMTQLNKDLIALHKTDLNYSNLKMRFVEDFPRVGLAIFDRNRCYIRIGQSLGDSLFTNNDNVTALAHYYFSSIWAGSQNQAPPRLK
jgi:sugar-specific transcriptional regulator TrmB